MTRHLRSAVHVAGNHTLSILLVGAVLLLCLGPGFSSSAHAGNGTFDAGNHNFCVSVRFNATAAQLAKIRTAFQNGSQVLADATDGQHRFGTITIVNNSGASQSAEYWINAGSGRAYATQGKYGVRGEHVTMFFDSNFEATQLADGDAYTIAHEHAHHSYGVLDEYSGPGGNAEDAPTPDTATLNFSLMDNYFTRGGRAFGGGYTLNEFCTAANHDPDHDTWQHKVHGQSVWEVIAAHPQRSAVAPTGLPVDAPPAAHVVNFKEGFGGLRVVLLLDRSGSMLTGDRLVFAKRGANLFTTFVRVGDGLGVASFADSPSVNFPLTTIVDDSTKLAAENAVNSLVAVGNTNIGGGLLTALGQITAQPERSCNEIIVLLSDGDHNTGTLPSAAIPQLKAANVTVFAIGVGSGISTGGEATLQAIATETGGRFFRVSNASDLVALFLRLAFESTGSGLLTRAPESISSGEVKRIPVFVEAGATSATFAVTTVDPASSISLSLETPSGTVITESNSVGNPSITFVSDPNSKAFQVQAPEGGLWHIVVSAGTVTTGTIEVLAFAQHEGVQLTAAAKKETVTFPEAVEIHATPQYGGEAVLGATVTALVTRPDGSVVPITLHDDGLAVHGDAMPGDGIYSARFGSYRGNNGTYTFEVGVVNEAGVTYAGEDLFSFDVANTKAVPPFTRMATATVVVSGVPPGSDFTIIGLQGVDVGESAIVSGDIASNATIAVRKTAEIAGSLLGAVATLREGARVEGDVSATTINVAPTATITGTQSTNVTLPVVGSLPPVQSTPGVEQVRVAKRGVKQLQPGSFASIVTGEYAEVRFTGGRYDVAELRIGKGSRLVFEGASIINVATHLEIGEAVGLTGVGGLTSDDIGLNYAGSADAVLGKGVRAKLGLVAPNGSIRLGEHGVYVGHIWGGAVQVGKGVQITGGN
jgi:Mg-chelatase subunit ChlD/cytoskeletal protein CcmA (bactofilin family)